jgi:RNA polymerase sigma-70 factor, ECF subfamily
MNEAEANHRAPECHRDYLLALARIQLFGWLGARLDASDLVQETLLKAQEARDQFRGTTAMEMRAWLRTILARTLANVARHHAQAKRNARQELSLDHSLEDSSRRLDAWLAAEQTSPSQRVLREERYDQLAEALERLPDDQRAVIVLKHAQGLSVAEIGARLELTVASVAGLLRRGLQQLRESMK